MKFCSECGQEFITGTEKFCPSCGRDLKKAEDGELVESDGKNSINIDHAAGDVIGVGVSGSGHIIGKNVVAGSGTINVSQTQLRQIPDEYATALKVFSEKINNQLKGKELPEEQIRSVNNSLEELAKEVQDVKPEREEEGQQTDNAKQAKIESKTVRVIQKVINLLPEAAETAAAFTPLAPFSKLIGKGVKDIVDGVVKRKRL
jgi:hypothetical protein